MAEKYKADVIGITISDYQINLANSYAKKSSASNRLRFLKRSYLNTEFEDNSFTKVVGLESTCYAHDKKDFVSEAYRVLKPGGKMLMMDAFRIRTEMTKKEQNHFQTFLKGWALPNLAHLEVLKQNFNEIGFKNIRYYDTTELIKKTIKTVYYNALVAYPITWLLTKLNLVDQSVHGTAKAGLAQKYIIQDGTTVYGCIVGEK